MTRRLIGLLITLALGFLVAPLVANGQPPGVPRIGWLGGTSPAVNPPVLEAFRQGLREHGWVEGRFERLPDLAAELVQLPVDVLVPVAIDPGILAAKHATSTIPIVMAVSDDPVEAGLIAILARPGGNITGLSGFVPEVAGKRLELLKAVVPQASRVAVLWNATMPGKALEWEAMVDEVTR